MFILFAAKIEADTINMELLVYHVFKVCRFLIQYRELLICSTDDDGLSSSESTIRRHY